MDPTARTLLNLPQMALKDRTVPRPSNPHHLVLRVRKDQMVRIRYCPRRKDQMVHLDQRVRILLSLPPTGQKGQKARMDHSPWNPRQMGH